MTMILRVLWPCSIKSSCTTQPSFLLGALLSSSIGPTQVVTAAIVALYPQELAQRLSQHPLLHCTVSLPTQQGGASLAVLGTWQPDISSHDPLTATKHSMAISHGLWLTLHGRMGMHYTLAYSCQHQPTWAPACNLQQCMLPPGTESVQFFVYAVPAQQQDFARVQLPVPAPAPQLSWMTPAPGAVSLSSLMHMLQEAHATIALYQLHQQHLHRQQTATQQAQQQRQQQHQKRRRRSKHSKKHQQQHQQPSAGQQQHHLQDTLRSLPAQLAQPGWVQLAGLLAAADNTRPRGWIRQQLSQLTAAISSILQALAHTCPAGVATATTASGLGISTLPPSPGRALQSAPGSTAGVFGSQGGVVQLVVQQLLGLLVGVNLLLHRQLVLDFAAACGAWLQDAILQPHIQWLMAAHPGGIKLHLELSLLLGTAAQAFLQLSATFYSFTWVWLGPAALLAQAAAAAVGGASRGCVAAADVLLVLLWPLVLLYSLTAGLHRLQLRCLATTWRLIRGKQKVRRFSVHHRANHHQQQQQQQQEQQQQSQQQQMHTTASVHHGNPAAAAAGAAPQPNAAAAAAVGPADQDGAEPGDEVSVEQLIVGVLLFTPLLGLLPTTVAWYLSVCWLYGCLHAARLLLLVAGSWMQLRPLHVLAARWSRPQLFPGQLMVLPLRPATAAGDGAAAQALHERTIHRHAQASRSAASIPNLVAGGSQGSDSSVPVAYYHAFYEPLGYWEVLTQSVAQQQGLLWYACQGVGQSTTGSGSGGFWLLRWFKDIAAGRTWGMRMLSTRWQFL